ncbi:MAG: tetratricopeptide repeat protein [Myxococcota bacterium]
MSGLTASSPNGSNTLECCQIKLTHTAENQGRREIYLKTAETYDAHLGMGDLAFEALTQAYNENRADVDLLDRLDAMAAKYNQWAELEAVLGQDLDALPDADLRQDLLRRLGDISGNRLNDPNKAIAYLQQALQYRPGDVDALATLDALFVKNEMWAALGDTLERRVEVATEPGEKSVLLERLAGLWGDKLMDAEAALRCHQQILEIDPDHPISLKSMQKLYAEVQDWDALAKNLSRQAEVLLDEEEQVRIHAAAGELYAEELSDMSAAIEHWSKVVEIDPAHAKANQALDILLSAEERWDAYAMHLQRRLSHTKDAAAKLDINRRLGVVLGEKLGRGEDALTSWLQVLEHEPKSLDALRALLELYDERAMWEDFVRMARRLTPLAEPAEAKDTRYRLARVLGENLGEREQAIKLAREVRAQEPHAPEELSRLGQMLVNIEAYDEAVVCFEKSAALTEAVDDKVALYYQATEIYRNDLKKPEDAQEAYESLIAAKPEDFRAFGELAQVYRDTQQWRKLVALNDAFLVHAPEQARLAILTEIRDVQDEHLGEK